MLFRRIARKATYLVKNLFKEQEDSRPWVSLLSIANLTGLVMEVRNRCDMRVSLRTFNKQLELLKGKRQMFSCLVTHNNKLTQCRTGLN